MSDRILIPRTAQKSSTPAPASDVIYDIDTAVPDGLPVPERFMLLAMPVRVRSRSKGGIFIPDDVITAQEWNHLLHKICAVGPHVYRGPAYAGLDMEAHIPKVGDLYLIAPRSPRRIKYQGTTLLLITDDQLWARVDPDRVDGLSFFGMEL